MQARLRLPLVLLLFGVAWAQPPVEIQSLIDKAVQVIAAMDQDGLAKLSTGNPKQQYKWIYRPAFNGSGLQFYRGNWKAAAIKPPGGDWQVVFWDYHPCESQGDHVHKLVHSSDGWKIGDEIPETDTLGYRFRDHSLTLKFEVNSNAAAITDRVAVERLRADAGVMQFRISADFAVTAVTVNDQPLEFTQAGGVVYATPPNDAKFALHLTYNGRCKHPDRFVDNFVDSTEIVLAAYWYPTIARLPTTNSVTATVPRGWTAISQGNLMFRTDREENRVFSFRMDVPNCYFTFAAGPYNIYQKTVNDRTYGVYRLKPQSEGAERQLEMMDESFRLFEKIWGPYPFDHYTIVETQQPGWGGALEAYTFTTYGRNLIPGDDPHEWGHTWWGGLVPCTYLQDIWNESFASYSSSVFQRHRVGSNPEALNKLRWSRVNPGMSAAYSAMPLSETADALFGPSAAVGYGKGALVMQNLEDVLGFDTLMKCMRAFRYDLTPGDAATWADFERAVNRTTKHNYKWWFDQWVRRAGLPSLKWANVGMTPTGKGFRVNADIVQEGEPYRLKVPVWLETEGDETIKTQYEINGKSMHVTMSCKHKPTRLILDPELRLPRVITTTESSRGRGDLAYIVYAEADKEKADALDRGTFGTITKLDTELTEEDIKNHTLYLIGSANKVAARFASTSPITDDTHGVKYHGKLLKGAYAVATSPNPLNPNQSFIWIPDNVPTAALSHFGQMSNARFALFDSAGGLQEVELKPVTGGNSVFDFTKP